jgi:hypothetical protein
MQDAVAYSDEQAVNGKGLCPANVSTRLARARLRIPAGVAWSFASGFEPAFAQEGRRGSAFTSLCPATADVSAATPVGVANDRRHARTQ